MYLAAQKDIYSSKYYTVNIYITYIATGLRPRGKGSVADPDPLSELDPDSDDPY